MYIHVHTCTETLRGFIDIIYICAHKLRKEELRKGGFNCVKVVHIIIIILSRKVGGKGG